MYRSRWLSGLAGLAVLFVLPAASFAKNKDYCVTVGSTQLIGKGFSIPAKNSCKSWVGFAFTFQGNSASSGSGCTAADGSTFNLTITTSEAEQAGAVFIDSVTLALPAQTGTDNETYVSGPTTTAFSATGAPCKGVTIPDVVTGPSEDSTAGVPH